MSKNDELSLRGSQILPKPRSKNLKSDPRVNLMGKFRPNSATHNRKNSLGNSSESSLRPKSADNVLFYREKQNRRFKEDTQVRSLEKPVDDSNCCVLEHSNIKSKGDPIDLIESSVLTKRDTFSTSASLRTNSPNMNCVTQGNFSNESENSLRGIRASSYLQGLKKSVWTSLIESNDKNSVNTEDADKNVAKAESESEIDGYSMEDHEKSKLDEVILQFLSKDKKDEIQFDSILTRFTKEEENSITSPLVSNVEETLVTLLTELENEVTFQSSVQNTAAKGCDNSSVTPPSLQEQIPSNSSPLSQDCRHTDMKAEVSFSQDKCIPYEIGNHPPVDSKEDVENGNKDNGKFPNSQLRSIAEDTLLSSPSKEVERVLKASKATLQQGIEEILNIEKESFQHTVEDEKFHQVRAEGRPTSCIGKSPITWTEFAETEDQNANTPELFDSSTKSFLESISIYMEEEYKKNHEQSKENEKLILDKEKDTVIENTRKYKEENDLAKNCLTSNKKHVENMDIDSINLSDEESMYESVVSALKIIEKEENETVTLSSRPPPTGSESVNTPRIKLTDILSFLDTVDQTYTATTETVPSDLKPEELISDLVTHSSKESEGDTSGKCASSTSILEMRLQEQAKGLSMMKKELKETKKRLQKEKEDLKKNLMEENEKVVQRHQEFIQKLLAEKQALADKCETLTATLKQTEENHKRNMKAIEEQHAISLRNERERIRLEQRASRDKWMREKTQKIQAVTAKGAEGEVKRLVSEQVHQIEALWRARLDELRGRLEREAEEGMAKERENARKRLEERVEELERFHQEERRKFLSEECLLRGRAEEAERKIREIEEEARRRRADDLEAERMRFQAKLEKVTEEMENRYQISLSKERAQREIAAETARKEERELLEADYRKQEARMKDRFRAERDQAIEKAVAHLTAQTEKTQLETEARAEMSLRRMRERCDEQVRIAEEEAEKQRKQCADLRSQSAVFQEEVAVLNLTVTRLEKELEAAHKMNNTLYEERSQIRDLVVEEWSGRVAALHEEVGILKAQITAEKDRKAIELIQLQKERELELVQIQKRVEVAVAKKEEVYNQLKAKYEGAVLKCSQLQELLEKQRMDLLLK